MHFLILYIVWGRNPASFFKSVYPIFPTPSVGKTILSSIELPGTFAKDHLLVNTIYFFILLVLFHWPFCWIFLPMSQSLDCYSLVVSFEIGKCESLNFCSFSRWFWLCSSLQVNFITTLLISRKAIQNFDRDYIEYVDEFGEHYTL